MKSKFAIILSSLLILLSSVAYAGKSKYSHDDDLVPIWERLGAVTEVSAHNPNGMEVVYALDKASIKKHKDNAGYSFRVAKMTKALNELVITYIRVAKGNQAYNELQSLAFYIDDGSFKCIKVKEANSMPYNDKVIFYRAEEKANDVNGSKVSNVAIPELPINATKFELREAKAGFETWSSFIDMQRTGVDINEKTKFTLVTYAFNPSDRLYRKGITIYRRTGPTSYVVESGSDQLFTYEDKLLEENSKPACYISDAAAHNEVRYYFMFYKHEK